MSPSKSVVDLDGIRKTKVANVFKGGLLAGTLRRTSSGVVEFRYDESYVSAGVPIAFSLPVTPEPVITPGGKSQSADDHGSRGRSPAAVHSQTEPASLPGAG